MFWRGVVIDLAGFDSLPSRPWWWFHNWRHSDSKQRSCFSKIDKVEQNPLIDMDIFNGKVEPESCTGIARVGTNKQIIFIFVDEINASQITYWAMIYIMVWYIDKEWYNFIKQIMEGNWSFLPVSNDESKHKWPFFAFPECPGGLITTRSTFPRPPSVSESSESMLWKNLNGIRN